MKRVICNHCHQGAPTDPYGSAPAGWLTVYRRGTTDEPADYCGVPCVAAVRTAADGFDVDACARS
jgi:hypothetical protein